MNSSRLMAVAATEGKCAFSRSAPAGTPVCQALQINENPCRISCGVRRSLFGVGQGPGQVLLALGQRMGIGRHRVDLLEPRARARHEVQVDIHDDLALNVQVDVVNQAVDGRADRPLDPVLNGHETEVDLAPGDRLEDGRDRGHGPQVGRGQVGLGQERFLGEGRFRAEVGHGSRRGVHSWAG